MNAMMKSEDFNLGQLVYGFEDRDKYLQQYASLVSKYYKKDLDLDLVENKMDDGLEQPEQDEYIYIVRDGERVVGGAKISFASVELGTTLPMEEAGFSVHAYLPPDYQNPRYAEIGRLVVDPTYRGKDVLHTMVAELTEFAVQQGGGYLFVLAPALNSVLYRRVCRNLKMPIELHKDANLPDKPLYRRLDIKLLSSDIRGLYGDVAATNVGQYAIAV